MDIERERRIIRIFEEALEWPRSARSERLEAALGAEPAILAEVLAMLRAAESSALLPTEPPEPALAASDPPMPDRIGKYRIIEEIGRGGMGLVYRAARDDGLFDQQVAIKVIRHTIFSASTLEQFANERRILARLHHPHIAHLLDGGVGPDGAPYIIMELIRGQPITDYVTEHHLPLAGRLALFGDACAALEYAHRELVVHADVKPSNVVIAAGFGVKLLDFGIARLIGEEGARTTSAHTPGYSSPARRGGERAIPADDVFALGVLLDQLISDTSGVDDDLRAVAAKASEPDASRRYGAVSDLTADLSRWQRNLPVVARQPDRLRRSRLFLRRNRLAVGAGALLGATAILTTGLFVHAEAARITAERRFRDVRSMASYMMFDLDPQLARLAGSLPARRSAAERSGRYLASLATEVRDDPELALEIVRSHLRLAGIYGFDPAGGLNDIARANDQLARAERLLRAQSQRSADPGRLALAQGEYLLTRAAADLVAETADGLPRARQSIEQAITRFDSVLRTEPTSVAADYGKWRAAIYLIRLSIYDGKAREGIAIGEAALSRRHPAPSSPGEQAEFDFLNTVSRLGLAQAQYEIKDFPAALKTYRDADLAFAEVDRAGRAGFESRSFRTVGFSGIGQCLQKLGRLSEAIPYTRRSLAELLDLRKAGPNGNLDYDIEATRQVLAIQLAEAGKTAEAQQEIDAAIAQVRSDLKASPQDPAAQRRLAVLMQTRAQTLLMANNRPAACLQADVARRQWELVARQGGLMDMDRSHPDGLPALRRMLRGCGLTADRLDRP